MFFLFLCIFFLILFSEAFGYKIFLISLPDNYGKPDKEKILYIGASEPAYGIIYDLKLPKSLVVKYFNGTEERLVLTKTFFFDPALNARRVGYLARFIPKTRGDYNLCLESEEILLRDNTLGKFFVKTPFHVFLERGWDRVCGFDLEIRPYTRPYGFRKHGVFWGQVWYKKKPLDKGIVEVENFSPVFLRLEDLPKDSYGEINYPYLKKTTKLSKNGFFVVSFETPGWWVVSVKVQAGEKLYGNQKFPYFLVHHFWIFVFPEKEPLQTYEYFVPFSKGK